MHSQNCEGCDGNVVGFDNEGCTCTCSCIDYPETACAECRISSVVILGHGKVDQHVG